MKHPLAAVIRTRSEPFEVRPNLRRADHLIDQACNQGAELALLPEFFHLGYTYDPRVLDFCEPIGGAVTLWLLRQSLERGIYLGAGLAEQADDGNYVTFVLATPQGEVLTYRKRFPFLFERRYLLAGNDPGIFHTRIGRIGVMLCWDIVHPELVAELDGKIDWLLISAAWPDLAAGNIPLPMVSEWMNRQPLRKPRALAAALKVPVLVANLAGDFETRVPGLPITYRSRFLNAMSIVDARGERHTATSRGPDVLVRRLDGHCPRARSAMMAPSFS